MTRAPAFTRICWSCSAETCLGSKVIENTCQPSVVLSSLKSTGNCASSRSAATRASGSTCQAHCLGTSPQTETDATTGATVSVGDTFTTDDDWHPISTSNTTPTAASLRQ